MLSDISEASQGGRGQVLIGVFVQHGFVFHAGSMISRTWCSSLFMRFTLPSPLFLKNEHLILSFVFPDITDASFRETSFAADGSAWAPVVSVRRVYKANRKK